jgi:myotubularin-related protein 5/13
MSSTEVEAVWLDKFIRAVFVRLFAQLFAGYRYCLLIIRINPTPVICFNKATFLANHCLVENEFMNRLLDSMSFQRFIEERGPSYRHCDVFDDLYADIQWQLKQELEKQLETTHHHSLDLIGSLAMQHLKSIADKLYKYEFPQACIFRIF